MSLRAAAAALALVLASVAPGLAAKPARCTGRYGANVALATGAPGIELIDVAARQVTLSSCGTARARVKPGRRFTRVKATFKGCPGIAGKAKLAATIAAPDCVAMQGTFRARKAGISTAFGAATGGTVGGTLLIPAGAIADVDTADPAMQGDNDTPSTAQLIPLIATVGGAAGPGDGTLATGNYVLSDLYRFDLDGTPLTITLNIANPEVVDLDLFLVDVNGNDIVAPSVGTANVEAVQTTGETGPAFVVVATYAPNSAGTTSYVLGSGQTSGAGALAAGVPAARRAASVLAAAIMGRAGTKAATTAATASATGASTAIAPARTAGTASTAEPDFVPGEVIVRYRDDVPLLATGRAAAASADATLVAGDPQVAGGGLFRFVPAATARAATDARDATLAAVEALRARPDVAWAQPNYLRHPLLVPNDQHYELQWHYPLISLPAAWDVTVGNPNVIVAVIDTGQFAHPDMDSNRFVPGFDFISDAGNARDGDGIDPDASDPGDRAAGGSSSFHGTHVAGTIGAFTNNGSGVAGIDWTGKIMPVRVLGQQGGADFDIAQGIRFAAGLSNSSGTVPAQRADVINMSLGGPGSSPAMREAVQAARAAGTIVVVAAGNENEDAAGFVPAAFPEAVCVSAVDLQLAKAPYSNFGDVVDVAAPGGDTSADRNGDGFADGVLSTLADDSGGGAPTPIFKFYQGTSMASPHVAGVVALMQAASLAARGTHVTPDEFDALLQSGALTDDIGSPNAFGFGLINASRAVAAAAGGSVGTGPPTLAPQPPSVNIPGTAGEAAVLVRNGGGGTLTVTSAAAGGDAPWLTVLPSTPLPAPATVTLRLVANRAGLPPGTYTGSLLIDSDAGSVTVPVALEVSSGTAGGDVGHSFVLLVDPATRDTVAQAEADRASGFGFAFGLVPGGSYLLVAGTDRDDDGFIGDTGEALGVYPTIDSPAQVDVPFGGTVAFDLQVLEQATIRAGSGRAAAKDAGGYRRLR